MEQEWYRKNSWNEAIATEFETKLRRARGGDSKAQYLKIQACQLLFSPDAVMHPIGINLVHRLFADYPSETMEVVGGYDALGEYYLRHGNWQEAVRYFKLAISHFGTSYIQKTYRRVELKLAEALMNSGGKEALSEAYQLISAFPLSELHLNSHLFYFNELAALVCAVLNKASEAKEYARRAIA
jgi:tetratricopeptide (TPR) repeat protein